MPKSTPTTTPYLTQFLPYLWLANQSHNQEPQMHLLDHHLVHQHA
jgi:hypothetical protein